MKKLLLIATLAVWGFQAANAQVFPIIGTVLAKQTKNAAKLSDSLKNDSTRITISNTGLSTLKFFMANSAAATAAPQSVTIPAGQQVAATVAQMGGANTGAFLNVTNLANEVAQAGAFQVVSAVIKRSLGTPTDIALCNNNVLHALPSWVARAGSGGPLIGLGGGGVSTGTPPALYVCPLGTNVGIGTTAPAATLDVRGNGFFQTSLNVADQFTVASSGNTTIGNSTTGANIKVYGSATINGNTTIGTATSTAGLTIISGSQTGLTLSRLASSIIYDNTLLIDLNNSNTRAVAIRNNNLFTYSLLGDGTLQTNGNVGIGMPGTIQFSDYKLSVNGSTYVNGNEVIAGNLHCKSVNVNLTSYPDFVFDKTYKLRSLKEVEDYINANHHLPEVPASTEVEANGADLGNLVKLQMQKIEELTLYTIEQNKRLETQQKEIDALKQQNLKINKILEK